MTIPNIGLFQYSAEHLIDCIKDCIKKAKNDNVKCFFDIESVSIKNEDDRQIITINYKDGNMITFISAYSPTIDSFHPTHNVVSVESSFATNNNMAEQW